MHFYAWKKGLKTGCYYLRTKAPVAAQKFTVDPRLLAALEQGGAGAAAADGEEEYASDSDSETEEPLVAPVAASQQQQQETRQEKLDRLAREYEEEVARARAAAEAGEGCLFCSS